MSIRDSIGHFSLWGDFDAQEITTRIGLNPSVVYAKGSTDLSDTPAQIATWDLYCPDDLQTSEQIDYLLSVLLPRAEEVRELASRYQGAMNVVGDGSFGLQPVTMNSLANLNLTLNYFSGDYSADPMQDGRTDGAVSA